MVWRSWLKTQSSKKLRSSSITSWQIDGENINNLRYADDTTLMAEGEEELESFLMSVKEDSEKANLKLNIKKKSKNKTKHKTLRSWHAVPSLHGKQKNRRKGGGSDRFSLLGL